MFIYEIYETFLLLCIRYGWMKCNFIGSFILLLWKILNLKIGTYQELMSVAKRICEGLMHNMLLACHTWLQYKDNIEFLSSHHYSSFHKVRYVIWGECYSDTNKPYSLLIRTSYFISWSEHARFTSVTFIVCKWRWGV